MAFDQELAERLRNSLAGHSGVQEKQMFGGMAMMLNGNMAVGVIGDELCVRCGPEAYEGLLQLPGARVFDFTGRPSKGMVMVSQEVLVDKAALEEWVGYGLAYAASLPPK